MNFKNLLLMSAIFLNAHALSGSGWGADLSHLSINTGSEDTLTLQQIEATFTFEYSEWSPFSVYKYEIILCRDDNPSSCKTTQSFKLSKQHSQVLPSALYQIRIDLPPQLNKPHKIDVFIEWESSDLGDALTAFALNEKLPRRERKYTLSLMKEV